MAEPVIKLGVANVKFGFTIGLLVTVNFSIREPNEQNTLISNGSLEVVVEDKDWTISELKAEAVNQAYATLKTLLSRR